MGFFDDDDADTAAATLALIDSEIRSGLQKNERDRMDRAMRNHEFYRGDFSRNSPRDAGGDYESPRYERTSLIMQRVVQVLTQHLYAQGPARSLPDDPEAGQWLADQYAREDVPAIIQEADRLALVGDIAAIQAVGTGEPEAPVKFLLWPAHQVIVWEDPDDPLRPVAVATVDRFDEQTRLRLWTDDRVLTYRTTKAQGTSGGTAFELESAEDNTYGLIPFAFIHANRPSTEFWSGGPGDNLQSLNDYANYFLTEIGDDLRYNGKPVKVVFGVGEGWTVPRPIRAGDVWYPTAGGLDAVGNGIEPSIRNLEADVGYVDAGWADFQSMLDHSLECLGVPAATVRMVQSAAKSGAAIVAEQLPLVLWAMGRQRAFAGYEKHLARVTLAVGAAELARLGRPDALLDPALAHTLTLRWPSLVQEIPLYGQDQDEADMRALAIGTISRIQIAMRKYNLDRDSAIAHLRQVAEDLAEEARLGLPPIPRPGASPADATAKPDPGQQQ